MSIFVTSDLHFGHNKSFLYEPRGCTSIEEHDAELIENWNSIISNEDTVYILGDIMLNDNDSGIQKLSQLNGNLKIIFGNHDTLRRMAAYAALPNVDILGYADMIIYKKYHFYLSHFPTLCADGLDAPLKHQIINLCGHSHTTDKFIDFDKGLIYHCEVDAHNNHPVSIDTIINDIKEKINEKI